MARYFVKTDKEHLAVMILTAFSTHDKFRYDEWTENYGVSNWSHPIKVILKSEGDGIPWRNLTPKIASDLKKCEFDMENVDCKSGYDGADKIAGFRTLPNGLTYLGVSAGGDWESPIFFIIYSDGKHLRAYMPKDGNPWNTDTKQAYGNDEESDNKNAKKRFGVNHYDEAHLDADLIIKDIESRIQPK